MFDEPQDWIYMAAILWLVAVSQSLFSVGTVLVLRQARWHWIIRYSIVPICMCSFLCASAIDLYWIFLIHFLAILVLQSVVYYRRSRRSVSTSVIEPQTEQTPQELLHSKPRKVFSLASVLFLTTVVACLVVLIRATDAHNRYSIVSMLLVGVTGGVVGVITDVVNEGVSSQPWAKRAKKWLGWWLVTLLMYFPLVALDWLLLLLLGNEWYGWPPEAGMLFGAAAPWSWTWFVVATVHVPLLLLLLWVKTQFRGNTTNRSIAVVLLVVMASLPVYTLVYMAWPDSIPHDLSAENAYPKVVQLAVEAHPLSPPDWDAASQLARSTALDEIEPLLAPLPALLEQPCKVPLTYSWADLDNHRMGELRNLARILFNKGRREMNKSPDDACESLLQGVQLGINTRQGGLLIHALTGVAISGLCLDELVANRRYYSVEQSLRAARQLMALEQQLESPDSIADRDRVWTRTTFWSGDLQYAIADAVKVDPLSDSPSFQRALVVDKSQLQMAVLALLIEAFQKQNSRYPESLDELNAEFDFAAQVDPYSPSGKNYVYKKSGTSYELYSLGPNQTDEGGIHDPEDVLYSDGDLPLRGLVPTEPANVGGPY